MYAVAVPAELKTSELLTSLKLSKYLRCFTVVIVAFWDRSRG